MPSVVALRGLVWWLFSHIPLKLRNAELDRDMRLVSSVLKLDRIFEVSLLCYHGQFSTDVCGHDYYAIHASR